MNKRILKSLASLKITVSCLALLFILVLWGTIAQVNGGLYLAQERFFNSLFFTVGGFIPFPGARLVLWVLFINLVCAAKVRLVYQWKQAGIIITHIGLLLFFVSAFVIFHGSVESNITLLEHAGTNVSTSYQSWELSIWTQDGNKRDVVALDTKFVNPGDALEFPEYGLSLNVEKYFSNCDAYTAVESPDQIQGYNPSGIKIIKPTAVSKEPERNFPGAVLTVKGANDPNFKFILYGGEPKPTIINKGKQQYYIMLRRKRFELPFIITLKDFKKDVHPNTQMARSYESLVEIALKEGGTREILISMNEPLRHKSFTLYQASYGEDQFGRELSTLAVVENTGRLLPYISSLTVCFGLLVHLVLMGMKKRKRKHV